MRVSLLLVAAAVPLLACGKLKERIQLLRAPPPPVVAAAPVAPPPPPAPPPPADPYQHVDVVLHGPLEKELSAKVAPGTAPALALVMQRLSLWWMSPGEERNGDEIRAVYELPAGHEPLVRALRYTSLKYGKTFTAYYYQPAGAPFGRYFTEDGTELEERLKDAPVANYEQVTSFLKDGRHHKGVDFKCPVGTPVVMPFDGTLVKKNWNWRGNGNCLEFTDDHTGHHAKFLHLSVLVYFGVKRRSAQWIRHWLVPLCGIIVVLAVFSGMSALAVKVGSVWLVAGLLYGLVLKAKHRDELNVSL